MAVRSADLIGPCGSTKSTSGPASAAIRWSPTTGPATERTEAAPHLVEHPAH